MNCTRTQTLISAYLDGELRGDEHLAVRSHLHTCFECSAELDRLASLKRMVASLPEPEMPAGLEERLVAKVLQPAPRPAPRLAFAFALSLAVGFAAWFAAAPLRPRPAALPEADPGFEIARDRSFQSMSDPASPVPVVYTSSYAQR